MRNIDKFNEEIKRLGDDLAITNKNEIKSCYDIGGNGCENCKFDLSVDCNIARWNWLFEEYKEPIKEPILDNIEKDDWSWVTNNVQVLHMDEETKKAYFKHLGIEGDESK